VTFHPPDAAAPVSRHRHDRFQASHVGSDGRRHTAPITFDTRGDAEAWIAEVQTDISREQWHRPVPQRRADTFVAYSATWLDSRLSRGKPLTARTRSEYRKLLAKHLLPTFGDLPLDEITSVLVRNWHGRLTCGPTSQAHAYGLLRAILNTAVADEAIVANPCKIRGAGTTRRARTPKPASLAELAVIVDEMPEEYRSAILVAAWCGLRFGEFAELRRRDVDLAHARLRVRRAVTHRRRPRRRRRPEVGGRRPRRVDPAAPHPADRAAPPAARRRRRRCAAVPGPDRRAPALGLGAAR
jgi:integrase